ncbi:MAG: ATP-grasp domain-containing protein [Candidatus Hodarchaeales archaeon]|jgi:carbamoyl-phosphate synthase large subunit
MTTLKVLFLPAGSGMAISAIKSLINCKDIQTVAADNDPLAPGLFLANHGFTVPSFSDPGFFPSLKRIIEDEEIDILFPCLDPLLEIFSNNEQIDEDLKTKLLISPPETIRITRDKWLSYVHLKDSISFPNSWITLDNISKQTFPLFIKPRKGSGSLNAYKVRNRHELEFFFNFIDQPIIQEHLPGKEYTVDCLASPNGDLVTLIPRERIQAKAGISVKGKFIHPNKNIIDIASTISNSLKFTGPFFFQLKENSNHELKLMEINARLSGTMIYSSLGGFNIVEQAIHQFYNKGKTSKKQPLLLPEKDYSYQYLAMSRYWEEIFISLEDLEKIERR